MTKYTIFVSTSIGFYQEVEADSLDAAKKTAIDMSADEIENDAGGIMASIYENLQVGFLKWEEVDVNSVNAVRIIEE